MRPKYVMGIIAGCTVVFAGVVTWLTMQGVHVLVALLVLYLLALSIMHLMQKRASQGFDIMDERGSIKHDRSSLGYAEARDCQPSGNGVGLTSETLK